MKNSWGPSSKSWMQAFMRRQEAKDAAAVKQKRVPRYEWQRRVGWIITGSFGGHV